MPGVTYADQTRHEDLSDALILADDRNVTFLPRVRKGPKMKASPYGWGVEKSNARRTQPVPEGIDVYAFEGDTSKKLYNRKQKWWRNPMVTTEAEELSDSTLGTSQDYAGQKAKKIREQGFDVETVLLSDQDSAEDRGVKDMGEALMALGRAINDGTSVGANGVALPFTDQQTLIPQDYRTPTEQIYSGYLVAADGVTPLFTEKKLNDMLRSRHDQLGGTAELSGFVGTLLKAHITENFGRYEMNRAGMTTITRLSRSTTTLTKGVDVFQGDNGQVDITQCSFMPFTTRGYFLDMAKVATRPLFYLRHSMLPYQGAGLEGLIESILGLEFGNPLQHMKIDPRAFQSP